MNLIIFTNSYPYDAGAEQTFIGRELPFLVRHFDKVIVVPKKSEGKLLRIPDGIEADEGFDAFIEKKTFFGVVRKALFSPLFYQDITTRPEILVHITMLARLIRFVGEAELIKGVARGLGLRKNK